MAIDLYDDFVYALETLAGRVCEPNFFTGAVNASVPNQSARRLMGRINNKPVGPFKAGCVLCLDVLYLGDLATAFFAVRRIPLRNDVFPEADFEELVRAPIEEGFCACQR